MPANDGRTYVRETQFGRKRSAYAVCQRCGWHGVSYRPTLDNVKPQREADQHAKACTA